MLTGQDLGAAIESARKIKNVTKKALAEHMGVKPPSVIDWVKRGTIDKEKLAALWRYFSDVVGPEHWGLEAFPFQSPSDSRGSPGALEINTVQDPRPISWEDLTLRETPDEFWIEVQDWALSPHILSQGDMAKMKRNIQPMPTDIVLVRDATGRMYVREYREEQNGEWIAAATNPAYAHITSKSGGVIVAVSIEERRVGRRSGRQ